MHQGDGCRCLAIGFEDFPRSWSVRIQQVFQFHAGDHIGDGSVTVLRRTVGIEEVATGGEDDGPYLDLVTAVAVVITYRAIGAGSLTGVAGMTLGAQTVIPVDHGHVGEGARIRDEDGTPLFESFMGFIRHTDRTGLLAQAAADTGVRVNAAILLPQFDQEIPQIACHTLYPGQGEQLDPLTVQDFVKLRGKHTGSALQVGKHVLETSCLPTDARRFLDQVDLSLLLRQSKRGTDAGNPGPHHQNVGLTFDFSGNQGACSFTRATAASTRLMAFAVASRTSGVTQAHCSLMLTIWSRNGLSPA